MLAKFTGCQLLEFIDKRYFEHINPTGLVKSSLF